MWAPSGSLFSKSGLEVYTNTWHNENFDMRSIYKSVQDLRVGVWVEGIFRKEGNVSNSHFFRTLPTTYIVGSIARSTRRLQISGLLCNSKPVLTLSHSFQNNITILCNFFSVYHSKTGFRAVANHKIQTTTPQWTYNVQKNYENCFVGLPSLKHLEDFNEFGTKKYKWESMC